MRDFNQFFERIISDKKIPILSSEDVDGYVQEINSSKLEGGIIKSKDGKLRINLDDGTITYDGNDIINT